VGTRPQQAEVLARCGGCVLPSLLDMVFQKKKPVKENICGQVFTAAFVALRPENRIV
jgi:hypothetical protein